MATIPPPSAPPEQPATAPRWRRWMERGAPFLFLALAIHLLVLVAFGGKVLFKGVRPKGDFQAAEFVAAPPAPPAPAPETLPAPPDETVPIPTAQVPTPAPDVVVTDALTPDAFTIAPPAPGDVIPPTPAPPRPSAAPAAAPGGGGSRVPFVGESAFGSLSRTDTGLVGWFYDLKQFQDRSPTPMAPPSSGNGLYHDFLRDKVVGAGAWNPEALAPYFKAPMPIGTNQLLIPLVRAETAPALFGLQKTVQPQRWVIYYEGTFRPPRSGDFRFVGYGDDILIVALDGKTVLDGSYAPLLGGKLQQEVVGHTPSKDGKGWPIRGGTWFSLSPARSYRLQILIGEEPGGWCGAFLFIQEKNIDYPSRGDGKGPVLPLFQIGPAALPKNYKADENCPAAGPPFVAERDAD